MIKPIFKITVASVLLLASCERPGYDPTPPPEPTPQPTPPPAPEPPPSPGAGATTTFLPNSLIIPSGASFQTQCGAISGFGLVYNVLRAENWLVANGYGAINVFYTYKIGKASPNRCVPTNLDTPPSPSGDPKWNDGCDFTITGSQPIKLIANTAGTNAALDTAASTINTSGNSEVRPNYNSRTIDGTVGAVSFLGAPFVIQAGIEANTFAELLAGTLVAQDPYNNNIDFSPFRSGTACTGLGSSHNVAIYRAETTFTAEVNQAFNATPPRLALLDSDKSSLTGNITNNILEKYLTNAGLNFPNAQGCPPGGKNAGDHTICPNGGTPGQVFDVFDFQDLQNNLETAKDSNNNPLYAAVWAPHWDSKASGGSPPTSAEQTAATNISSFLDGATGLAGECASIQSFEGGPKESDGQFLLCKDDGTGNCATGGNPYADPNGLQVNSSNVPTNAQPNCTDPNVGNGANCYFWGYPDDPYSQVGDYMWTHGGGTVNSFVNDPGKTMIYRPGVKVLISGVKNNDTTKTGSPTSARSIIVNDFAIYGNKDSDPTKGQIHYFGNHDMTGTTVGNLFILQTLLQLGLTPTSITPVNSEVTRSSPVVAAINGNNALVQGTFDQIVPFAPNTVPNAPTFGLPLDVQNFQFPGIHGHLYAVNTTDVSTTPTQFKNLGVVFDASTLIPTPSFGGCTHFNSSCRTVFTNTATGLFPVGGGGNATTSSYTFLESSGKAAIGTVLTAAGTVWPLLAAADQDTLLQKFEAGTKAGASFIPKLGGVDRSTVSVVPSSIATVARKGTFGSQRATIIYVGATDGMLHAICGSVGFGCDVAGRELWAFMPRVQLPHVLDNTTRIDGSPRAVDVFADLYNEGHKSFKTLIIFQTGSGVVGALSDAWKPAAYALDVTDPTDPRVVWEYVGGGGPPHADLGVGINVAEGQATVGGLTHNVTYLATTNGDSGCPAACNKPGMVVTALDTETGGSGTPAAPNANPLWMKLAPYSSARTPLLSGTIPQTAVPGGVVGVDALLTGKFTDVVFGTPFGEVYKITPDGTNENGGENAFAWSGSLFSMSVDRPIGTPPAIYTLAGSGQQYAAFATGGYDEPGICQFTPCIPWNSPVILLWPHNNPTEIVFSVLLGATPGPIDENNVALTAGLKNIGFVTPLGAGERGFSQPTIVGTDLFVTTDTANVNDATTYAAGATSGTAYKIDTQSGTAGTILAMQTGIFGAGSVAFDGTTAYESGGATEAQLGTVASSVNKSLTVQLEQSIKVVRNLWLRTE